MQIVRTLLWVLILFAILLFSWVNWQAVEVRIWENMLVETKVPALVIISFLLGLIPMWLYHRGVRWNMSRKIASLENAARTNTVATSAPETTETSTTETVPATDTSPARPEPVERTESERLAPERPSDRPADRP